MGNTNIDHNYFRAIQGCINSESEDEILREERRMQFAEEFDESIGVCRTALRNDKRQDFIFKSTQEKNQFLAYARPGEEINIGDILYWNGMHWLVKYKDFNDTLFTCATIVCCNRQIKWQNKAGEIITRWCFAEKPYTSDIEEGTTLTLLKGKYNIQLPYDAETIDVPIGKRFMLDTIGGYPMCYKLVFSDVNTNKYQDLDGGFIEWNLESDEFQKDHDNAGLMLCDYVEPSVESETETDKIQAIINGRDEIKLGGSRTYKATFLKQDGTYMEDDIPTLYWRIKADDDVLPYIHTVPGDKSCVISCDMREILINRVFTIELDCDHALFENTSFDVKVVSAFG